MLSALGSSRDNLTIERTPVHARVRFQAPKFMGVVSVDSFLGTTTCLIGYYYAFLRQICHKDRGQSAILRDWFLELLRFQELDFHKTLFRISALAVSQSTN